MNAQVQAFYNGKSSDDLGAEWQRRLQRQFPFPKWLAYFIHRLYLNDRVTVKTGRFPDFCEQALQGLDVQSYS
jgi:hypothetical protein